MRDTEHLYQKIMEELDLSREIEDEALMELIYTVLSEERREHYMSLQEMNMLGKELFNAFRKLDILQDLIEDEEITEIMINGAQHIFMEKAGVVTRLEKRFASRQKLEDVVQQIVAGSNRIVNEGKSDCGCKASRWFPCQCRTCSDCAERTDCDDQKVSERGNDDGTFEEV